MDNIRTILIDMPPGVRGYTILSDDYYTIVINAKLSYEMQRLAYYHEYYHIIHGDFESKNSVGLIEFVAHDSRRLYD